MTEQAVEEVVEAPSEDAKTDKTPDIVDGGVTSKTNRSDADAEPDIITGEKPEEGAGSNEEVSEGSEATKKIEYGNFTIPENMNVDERVLDKFKEIGGKNNITQEVAQEFIDLMVEHQEGQVEALNNGIANWKTALKDDSDLGGSNLDKTAKNVNGAITEFARNAEEHIEIIDIFKEFGIGNNKAFVGMVDSMSNEINTLRAKVKEYTGNDDISGTLGGGGKAEKSLAEKMYPNMT